TMNVHRLPVNMKSLLDAAVLLHNLAFAEDPNDHHLRGRDLILSAPIRGFTDEERDILACITAFHRGRVLAEREPAFVRLPEPLQRDTLALTAILRIADALDSSGDQSTQITGVQVMVDSVLVTVDGPNAALDAARSQAKGDLWSQVFGMKVRVAARQGRLPTISLPKVSPALRHDMTIGKAGRAFAEHTLVRITALLKGIDEGDLSLLSVLSRESSRLYEAIVLAALPKGMLKEANWLKDCVEEIRLTWVIGERLAAFGEETDNEIATSQAADWAKTAKEAVANVDRERFGVFVGELREALANDIGAQKQIAFHAGAILFEHLAALRDVMETGTSVVDALEAARRLQDYLIAFRDLLGPEVTQSADMMAPFEGYLAAIQTTQAVLERLEPKPTRKGRKTIAPPPDPLMDALRTIQVDALESLADGLPAAWSAVNSPIFRRTLALAVAVP
ncbi:MAG TPA: hypothetical protein VMT34_08385, partial [Aggregatilineales bacterium]|nr:hypothetical protein [Aggregatilineales bacterium]